MRSEAILQVISISDMKFLSDRQNGTAPSRLIKMAELVGC
jgi:hypothetical protein